MALSLTDKIHVVRDEIPTANLGSTLLNSGRDAVSVQDILNLGVETGTFTPTIQFLGNVNFSSVTYENQHGWWSKVNNQITVKYFVEISAFTISKQTGTTIIPYINMPFIRDTSIPMVHTVGRREGTLVTAFMGGEGVAAYNNSPTGITWEYLPTTGSPPLNTTFTDTKMYTYSTKPFIVSGIVSYITVN